MFKTDSQGNVVREISLGQISYNEVPPQNVKASVDSSGNIYFAGIQEDSSYNTVLVIAKYNTNGALQWQRTSTVGSPTGVAVSSSNVYVVGTKGYAKYTSSGNLVWTKTGAGNDITVSGSYFYVRRGSIVLKYDSNGKQLWAKTQSGISSPVYSEMTGDSAGNIYLSGKYAVSSSNRDGFVRKLNASGTVIWTKTFGTTAYDDVRGITSVNGSEILITGETQGSLSPLRNQGGPDGYVRELNSSGTAVWTR